MYKIAVLGDRESVLGFKTLGLDVHSAETPEEARRIREAGAELIRTDETGTVRFFLDGAEVQVIE